MQNNTPISAGQLHYYHTDFYYSMPNLHKDRKMHGVKRVLIFCLMIVLLPAALIIIPLYLRRTVFADVVYPVAESDIIEIRDGISSIFCSQHTLRMGSSFNAFQLQNKPEKSTKTKHIRLKKSMTLPDDTLEYWGFFLLKGARVKVKFCSSYDGSRIMVVKGGRELKLCGLTDHNKNKYGADYANGHEDVKVYFEDVMEITEDKVHDGIPEFENHGGEDLSDDGLSSIMTSPAPPSSSASAPVKRRKNKKLKKGTIHHSDEHENSQHMGNSLSGEQLLLENSNSNSSNDGRRRRRSRHHDEKSKQILYDQLYKHREKREKTYDRKYSHGGNAINFTETDESNSVSSFETGLWDCFKDAALIRKGFPPFPNCTSLSFLENGSHRMLAEHDIKVDGYYYYIFYSDNDLVRNDIHAIFDIYKPTFQYSNVSDSQGCLNATHCTFPIGFLSDEIVVVEVPTRDGIEHEEDDITHLISSCHPRSEIYALFPIAVLLLILCCSFI